MRVSCRLLAGAVAATLVGLLLTPAPASAHVRSTTGYSEITQQNGEVRYRLSLEYELLAATLGLGQQALDAPTDPAREAALTHAQPQVGAYLERSLGLSLDGVHCPAVVEDTSVKPHQDVPYAVVTLAYRCPGPASGGYTVRYGIFSDSNALVDEHTNIVDYALGGDSGQFVFDSGHRRLAVGAVGLASSTTRLVPMGVEHILAGADHILFVVALLLGAAGFRSVMTLALTFTAAHSVTLGLAALGWVEVPSQIVEPLIALSIAYVAADNLLGGNTRHRLPVTFGFGLLHGLGFAGALTFTSDLTWQTLLSLLAFNVGIEVGQALIIAALFPLLVLVRRRFAWSNAAHSGATAVIAALGISWFFARVVG